MNNFARLLLDPPKIDTSRFDKPSRFEDATRQYNVNGKTLTSNVLDVLQQEDAPMYFSDISEALGHPLKTSLKYALQALVKRGLIVMDRPKAANQGATWEAL